MKFEITWIGLRDRISKLQDSIILLILSFMDAKTAVRTGILSKRFSYLWTQAPCLNFELATMKFIYSTISFHNRLNLEKVSAIIYRNGASDPGDKIKFLRFIRFLSLSSVKEFILDFEGVYYALPQHFYSNPSLEKLSLTDCRIKPTRFVYWKSLQSLSLDFMKLSSKTINNVLSGCPSLEFLELSRIRGCSQINLTYNKCLRKLVIDHYHGRKTLEIFAPNLLSLVLSGGMKWIKCRVRNAKLLTDCFLDFYDDNENPFVLDQIEMLTSLLNDLSAIEAVVIGEWVLQVLSLLDLHKLPCPLPKAIKCLQIHTSLTEDDMTGIASLLHNLIHLDTLSIELYDHDQEYILPFLSGKDQEYEIKKRYWTSENMETKVKLLLKNVKISYLVVDKQFEYGVKEFLLLAEFVLKNANILENMTVSARGSSEHSLLKFANTLLEFPRCSRLAVVKIEDW